MGGQAASDNMQTSDIICKWIQQGKQEYREGGRQSQGHGKGFSLTLSGGWEIRQPGSLGKKKKGWEYCFSVLPLCESKTPHQEAT